MPSFLHCSILYKTSHLNDSTPTTQHSSLRATVRQYSEAGTERAAQPTCKEFCKFHTLLPAKKNLGPDSAFFGLLSLIPISPPPACDQQRTLSMLHSCLDAAPRKHLEVTDYGLTYYETEQAQIDPAVKCSKSDIFGRTSNMHRVRNATFMTFCITCNVKVGACMSRICTPLICIEELMPT